MILLSATRDLAEGVRDLLGEWVLVLNRIQAVGGCPDCPERFRSLRQVSLALIVDLVPRHDESIGG